MPPHRAARRRPRRLSLGGRAQARAARQGARGRSDRGGGGVGEPFSCRGRCRPLTVPTPSARAPSLSPWTRGEGAERSEAGEGAGKGGSTDFGRQAVTSAGIADFDLAAAFDRDGYAVLPGLLGATECRALTTLYDDHDAFRSRVVMARHGFGQGEYKYLAYPLPPVVEELRQALYPQIAPIANRWQQQLGLKATFPNALDSYLARC